MYNGRQLCVASTSVLHGWETRCTQVVASISTGCRSALGLRQVVRATIVSRSMQS